MDVALACEGRGDMCPRFVVYPHGGFGTLVARQERFAKTNLEICEVLVDSDVTIKPDLIFNLRV